MIMGAGDSHILLKTTSLILRGGCSSFSVHNIVDLHRRICSSFCRHYTLKVLHCQSYCDILLNSFQNLDRTFPYTSSFIETR